MKHIAVIGAGGMLGWAVSEYFARRGDAVKKITRGEFDIATDDIRKLETALGEANVVINCAGVIKPRIAETPIEHVLGVNAIFPRNLARLCKATKKHAFHVTTDCVYSGADGGYNERAYFDADDVYGLSKNAGDTSECMVLRTSIIGEENGQQRSLLEWARSQAGKSVNGFVNHRWNGVTTLHLAEIIEGILDRGLYESGIFHVHSPETVNKLELLQSIDAAYELGMQINPADAAAACDRSLSSIHPLSAELATKPLLQQLQEMRRFFAAS